MDKDKHTSGKIKLMGIGMIILAVLSVLISAEQGQADGTAAILMISMGLMMLVHNE